MPKKKQTNSNLGLDLTRGGSVNKQTFFVSESNSIGKIKKKNRENTHILLQEKSFKMWGEEEKNKKYEIIAAEGKKAYKNLREWANLIHIFKKINNSWIMKITFVLSGNLKEMSHDWSQIMPLRVDFQNS